MATVLDHGQCILGAEVVELEQQLAAYVAVGHCVAVASGTHALLIALMALGVQVGDVVISTPFSFVATAETIAVQGAVTVYVEIDPAPTTSTPTDSKRRTCHALEPIIPVSLYGQPVDF
jgi:UDP-2-acetamido-2-deoxy-ribo-hexuluronate aminotransferase